MGPEMRLTRAVFLALTAVLILLAPGCGKKVWPEPDAREDIFFWGDVDFMFEDGCLNISAILEGASGNLSRIELELEFADQTCPSCPFVAHRTSPLELDSPQVWRNQNRVRIKYCQIPPDTPFRWRLVGKNIYEAIAPVASQVFSPIDLET
ncbi:MAG: hypothetical protein EOM25_09645, partial [Deltaproteobacteria bacterium]|nr:hypothetical protein [Deltaproteobacteria bacterium]